MPNSKEKYQKNAEENRRRAREYHNANKEEINRKLREKRAKERELKKDIPKPPRKAVSDETRKKQSESLKLFYADKKVRIEINCENCGISFEKLPSNEKKKFCSKRCHFEHISKNPLRYWKGKKLTFTPKSAFKKGNIPHNYIDGKSRDDDGKARSSVELKAWRKLVFERDNYTCQKCGTRGGILNPHHILNFRDYKELRFDLNNGITLCETHHKEFHKIYSKKGNNRDQLDEYLSNGTKQNTEEDFLNMAVGRSDNAGNDKKLYREPEGILQEA